MYDELDEQMDLNELRKLRDLMKDYGLAVRILNMLWVNFSNDQAAECLIVDDESVQRFKEWLASGNPDDARS